MFSHGVARHGKKTRRTVYTNRHMSATNDYSKEFHRIFRGISKEFLPLNFSDSRKILGDAHPHPLASIHNLGLLRLDQGRLAEAEPLYREALQVRRQRFGDGHPDTVASMCLLRLDQGRLKEAEALLRETLEAS